ncbi:Copia protein [Porphyridium purpureum]|uniref:Copia protein n=1 Tax=Porphyridium purpureum TaxID=35688 RepID=A0A5J4YKV7_PORPP|nr:Copia protein [Porphyridium purpureum]|eukprot:POR6633..scf249_10
MYANAFLRSPRGQKRPGSPPYTVNGIFSYYSAINSGIEPSIFQRALDAEIENWRDGRYTEVSHDLVFPRSNIIGSHIVFKLKFETQQTLKLKARLVLWGHLDKDKAWLISDTPTLPIAAVRLVFLTAATHECAICKVDVIGAYLQSGPIDRDVYVRPPPAIEQASILWKLNAKAYGLIDAGRQWLLTSDKALTELGLQQSKLYPQLFYNTSLLVCKFVDDIILCGPDIHVNSFVQEFNSRFTLGSVETNNFLYLGTSVSRDSSGISVSMKDYAEHLSPIKIRGQTPEQIQKHVRALAGSLNRLGHSTSPVAAFMASYLQQLLPTGLDVKLLRICNGVLKELHRSSHQITYKADFAFNEKCTIAVFSDAGYPHGKNVAYAQQSYVLGLLDVTNHFAPIAWNSSKQKRVTYDTFHAELTAIVSALEHEKLFQASILEVFGKKLSINILFDSKGVNEHLATSNSPKHAYIVKFLACLREAQDVDGFKFIWCEGTNNLADAATKRGAIKTTKLVNDAFNGNVLSTQNAGGVIKRKHCTLLMQPGLLQVGASLGALRRMPDLWKPMSAMRRSHVRVQMLHAQRRGNHENKKNIKTLDRISLQHIYTCSQRVELSFT